MKLFITAEPGARARRRWLERGQVGELAAVEAELRARDAQDAGRDVAPLRPAEGAVVIDTTALDADAVFARAMAEVSRAFA